MSNSDSKNVNITISVKSTPFASDPEGAELYYETLGRAVFLWGCFESTFDMCLLSAKNLADDEVRAAEFPISWKRKAELWKAIFKTVPALDSFRDHALELIKEAMDTAQVRHLLFHGHFECFIPADTLTARLRVVRHKKGQIQFLAYTVPIDHLDEFAQTADNLNTALIPYLWNLSRLQPWPKTGDTGE